MGRKTFDSLPGVLPQRLHIVITRSPESFKAPENPLVLVASSLENALQLAQKNLSQ